MPTDKCRRLANLVIPPDIIDPPPQHPVVTGLAWAWVLTACAFAYYSVVWDPRRVTAITGFDLAAYNRSRCLGVAGLRGSLAATAGIAFEAQPGTSASPAWCLVVKPSLSPLPDATESRVCASLADCPPRVTPSGLVVDVRCTALVCEARGEGWTSPMAIAVQRPGIPEVALAPLTVNATGQPTCIVERDPTWQQLLAESVAVLVTAFGWLGFVIRVCFRQEVEDACRERASIGAELGQLKWDTQALRRDGEAGGGAGRVMVAPLEQRPAQGPVAVGPPQQPAPVPQPSMRFRD